MSSNNSFKNKVSYKLFLLQIVYVKRDLEAFMVHWFLFWEMDMSIWVQNLNKDVCISDSADIFGKVMNPAILLLAMGK